MKKYHEIHERIYQDLEARGFITWDKHLDFNFLSLTPMNKSLKYFLGNLKLSLSHLSVLDLGTGAGNCALFCASYGAKVLGVDAAPTAIKMALLNATNLAVKADFIVSDVLHLNLEKKFDLVTDSSLLHCLVGEADREKFYSTAKQHLHPGGLLFIHTMTKSSDMGQLINPQFFYLEDDILWSTGFEEIQTNRKTFKGKSYFPHRTIMKEEHLLNEVEKHGFELMEKIIISEQGQPNTLIGLFRVSSSGNQDEF
jgi:2-polyprenyl-3-methyl-5-hydroxy-6-metoxy-1,4-benzoquinol methylase